MTEYENQKDKQGAARLVQVYSTLLAQSLDNTIQGTGTTNGTICSITRRDRGGVIFRWSTHGHLDACILTLADCLLQAEMLQDQAQPYL